MNNNEFIKSDSMIKKTIDLSDRSPDYKRRKLSNDTYLGINRFNRQKNPILIPEISNSIIIKQIIEEYVNEVYL